MLKAVLTHIHHIIVQKHMNKRIKIDYFNFVLGTLQHAGVDL